MFLTKIIAILKYLHFSFCLSYYTLHTATKYNTYVVQKHGKFVGDAKSELGGGGTQIKCVNATNFDTKDSYLNTVRISYINLSIYISYCKTFPNKIFLPKDVELGPVRPPLACLPAPPLKIQN